MRIRRWVLLPSPGHEPRSRLLCRAGRRLSDQSPVELIASAAAGGGTRARRPARAFAEAARSISRRAHRRGEPPGAAGSIGFTEVANAKPDGYKLGIITVNLAILPRST